MCVVRTNSSDKSSEQMAFRLFVGNLPMDIKKSEIEDLFEK
jgi:RNA recognition motif-containing protein